MHDAYSNPRGGKECSMKSASIASVLACLAFCVPLVRGAEETITGGTLAAQTQSDTQSGTTAKPDEGSQTKLEKSWLPPRSYPHRQKNFPFPCRSFQEKISKSRTPTIGGNHPLCWVPATFPGRPSLKMV